jgi:hypothetical protein
MGGGFVTAGGRRAHTQQQSLPPLPTGPEFVQTGLFAQNAVGNGFNASTPVASSSMVSLPFPAGANPMEASDSIPLGQDFIPIPTLGHGERDPFRSSTIPQQQRPSSPARSESVVLTAKDLIVN